MGCSNPHPHGQVHWIFLSDGPQTEVDSAGLVKQAWCLSYVPTLPKTILSSLREFSLERPPPSSVSSSVPT
jgi:hypothetical protein